MSEQHDPIRARTRVHRVCAWCRAVLGTSHSAWQGKPVVISHGVCRSCLLEARLRGEARAPGARPISASS